MLNPHIISLIIGGEIIVILAIFFLPLIRRWLEINKENTKMSDTGTYSLIIIAQIAAIIYAIVMKVTSAWIFLPLLLGFLYVVGMKVFGIILALRATKTTDASQLNITQLNEMLKNMNKSS